MANDVSWPALRRRLLSEVGPLFAIAVAALGLLVFGKVAEESLEGETHAFDRTILFALRTPGNSADPIGPAWLEHAVGDLTSLGGYAVLTLLMIGVCAYLVAMGKRGSALLIVGAVVSGALLSESLKMGFARPRPDLVPHMVVAQSGSFPSGHAMLSAVAYLTIGALLARVHEQQRVKSLMLGFAIALTFLVGASRVYLGVHWPTDVLAGWSLGAAWAALWWLLAWWLQRRGTVEGAET
jgi:undecaprenyl-diphosphatase